MCKCKLIHTQDPCDVASALFFVWNCLTGFVCESVWVRTLLGFKCFLQTLSPVFLCGLLPVCGRLCARPAGETSTCGTFQSL